MLLGIATLLREVIVTLMAAGVVDDAGDWTRAAKPTFCRRERVELASCLYLLWRRFYGR